MESCKSKEFAFASHPVMFYDVLCTFLIQNVTSETEFLKETGRKYIFHLNVIVSHLVLACVALQQLKYNVSTTKVHPNNSDKIYEASDHNQHTTSIFGMFLYNIF